MSPSDVVESATDRSGATAPSELEHGAHDHVAGENDAADEDSIEVPGLEDAQATGAQVCT